ncbi:MAG: DUF2794 domain-containing protein [Rhodospirillaceae bacterium]|jgi:hypothetical protein|nr:DUF2794 domain-containing protein [Rhodospirillaceae bacterium]MBT4487800.1 DUF2794 domain-containing protein [Rhodospirillaceae bacterium]MBT5193906.1 DUF2794 domain-containing protein [Rhodospirillaceae bacterium]MBT5895638.1 DUF2794 domain-containing protein [Rhodospirillaceae bacterium]MBT6427456.1 DUF2794 domain-containing protein [Rhodospirillaceae bacterium]
MTEVVTFEQARRRHHPKAGGSQSRGKSDFFNRQELREILQSYSRGVIAGDWLDYAVDWSDGVAMFAVYGQVSAVPMYSIVKRGKQGRRSAGYQLLGRGGVLKSDRTLGAILKLLDSRRTALVKSDR